MITSTILPTPQDMKSKKPANFTSEALELKQYWNNNNKPEEDGIAYVGHCETGLRFYTWFEDPYQICTATKNNQKLFKLGSVAEFFILPSNTDTYWEIHLSPNNLLMDIKIPSNKKLLNDEIDWQELISHNSNATYQVKSYDGFWTTDITIPWETFQRNSIPTGEIWRFSICRYNYLGTPDIFETSSTSQFPIYNFHDIKNYNLIKF